MYVGKTLFAEVMTFVPWTSLARIVQRRGRGGNSGVRTLSCVEQFGAMAFAQLTWWESLRDIEANWRLSWESAQTCCGIDWLTRLLRVGQKLRGRVGQIYTAANHPGDKCYTVTQRRHVSKYSDDNAVDLSRNMWVIKQDFTKRRMGNMDAT
jgi:hypothetical protein